MGLNSRSRIGFAAFAVLALVGATAATYLCYSTVPGIAPPRFVVRPPEPPRWSPAWRRDRGTKATLAKSALSKEQIEVYSAFLKSYGASGPGRLNVGNRTTPLDISEDDIRGCLTGLEPEPSADMSTVHRLAPEMFSRQHIRLVDAEQQESLISNTDPSHTIREGLSVDQAVEGAISAGLLRFSEVVFTVDRGFAVVEFSFSCGSLCGQGGTVVFERSGQQWKRSDRSCHSYVN